MLDNFLILYAPFLMVILSIAAAFWFAKEDEGVRK